MCSPSYSYMIKSLHDNILRGPTTHCKETGNSGRKFRNIAISYFDMYGIPNDCGMQLTRFWSEAGEFS